MFTCRYVLAPGALVLNWTEKMGKMKMLAMIPTAYQKGPAIPFCEQKAHMGGKIIDGGPFIFDDLATHLRSAVSDQ